LSIIFPSVFDWDQGVNVGHLYLAVNVLLCCDCGVVEGVSCGRGDILGKAMLSCVAEVPSISRLRPSTNIVGLVLSHFPHFLLREGFADHV